MSYILGIIGILTCIGAVIHATRQGKDEGLFDLDAYRKGEGKNVYSMDGREYCRLIMPKLIRWVIDNHDEAKQSIKGEGK